MIMENKINIAELLKDCPKGMELDCTMYDDITLVSVEDMEYTIFPIRVLRKDGCSIELTKYGQYADADYAKCVIYPKGKTTWDEFVPPCKFKVGDKIKHKDSGIYCTLREYSEGISAYRTNIGLSITCKDLEDWELVPNKFDITTLKPFESRVLVRHNKDNTWCGSFFSHIDDGFHSYCHKYVTITGKSYPMCIPYEGNEHLLGTTDDCDVFYKNW